MKTLEDFVYEYLSHGHDKNGLSLGESNDRVHSMLNRMSNVEFLELLSLQMETLLDTFALQLEQNK